MDKKFRLNGKNFYQMSKNDIAKKMDHVIYYCTLHNTIIGSNKYTSEGKKKKISKCNSRIFYYKNTYSYIMDWGHSDFCDIQNIPKYENIASIVTEITNYKEFKKEIIDYLEKYPIIKYIDYKKKVLSFYYKNNCLFNINDNTFKNIYYNWRRTTNIYKKFSIFKYNKTLNNHTYLQDYCYTLLYNSKGSKKFIHEHIIFCSDYFIKKLRLSKHWYIDGTFVKPPNFKQLIIILFFDENTNDKYPALYALINNKTKVGYEYLFKKIYNIISIENTKKT